MIHGALSSPRRAVRPLAVALGGMALQALIYLLANLGPWAVGAGNAAGWGVPAKPNARADELPQIRRQPPLSRSARAT
jgi:Na+/H+ antiporter NhaA